MDRTREEPIDPFKCVGADACSDSFEALTRRPASWATVALPAAMSIGVLRGFDLLERPVVGGLPMSPGELVPARSTVALRHDMIGAELALTCHNGDWARPIILGVLLDDPRQRPSAALAAEVDGERLVLQAQREVVLKCGDASITLTRAGKVIIRGQYILSRSSGYNKIKGAAIDIN